jgi:hypothetical protein
LWRNQNGAGKFQDGRFIRFGLANESQGLNKVLKSADLIGIRSVVIEPWMVGFTFGQFVSREVKVSGRPIHPAQQNWCDLINKMGGDAMIVTDVGSL